jgi:aldehyde dehydrogenase (NAD+)
MTVTAAPVTAPRHPDRFFIGGGWVTPSSTAMITVTDSATEQPFLTVAEAAAADITRAVTAAREAFDTGPWPRMTHAERAGYLRAFGAGIARRADQVGQIWPREAGVLHSHARHAAGRSASFFERYAALAGTFPFEERATPSSGEFGLLVREPVGVVGAIIPWNGPLGLITHKIAPALLAGCTVVLKASPEASLLP